MRVSYLSSVAAVALAISVGGAYAQNAGGSAAGGAGASAPSAATANNPATAPAGGDRSGASGGTAVTPNAPGDGAGGAGRGAANDATPSARPAQAQSPMQKGPGDRENATAPADRKMGADQKMGSDQKAAPGQKAAQDNNAAKGAGTVGSAPSADVRLTTEQRTVVRERVLSSGPRASNINFSLNIGTTVPRTVTVVEVPQTIIEINPRFRGYSYFIANDQIVIVDRNTLAIIAILDV